MKRRHPNKNGPDRPEHAPRRGTILIIAMVAVLILTAMSSTLVQCVVQTRTQFIREEQLVQTALLVEAGLHRGVAQLRGDATYVGETWMIPAEPASGLDPAKVTIAVTSADATSQRVIVAIAEYPHGTPNPIRVTRQVSIPKHNPTP